VLSSFISEKRKGKMEDAAVVVCFIFPYSTHFLSRASYMQIFSKKEYRPSGSTFEFGIILEYHFSSLQCYRHCAKDTLYLVPHAHFHFQALLLQQANVPNARTSIVFSTPQAQYVAVINHVPWVPRRLVQKVFPAPKALECAFLNDQGL